MVVFSHAKINIGLNITSKRDDGYHNLESLFYPIPLYDILEVVPASDFSFKVSGPLADVVPNDNLVTQAYYLLKNKFRIGPAAIHLHKSIPAGGGLGGGSSNGTFALRAMNQIFSLGLDARALKDLSLELGSDCPFFADDMPAFVTGRGENINPSGLNLSGYYLKLVNPGIHVSTAEAFTGILPKPATFSPLKLTNENFEDQINLVTNDFETSVFSKYSELEVIKTSLLKEGAVYASMTGTGSTIYGIFNSPPSLNNEFLQEHILKMDIPLVS